MKLTLAAHLYNHILIGGLAKERYETFARSMFSAYGKILYGGNAVWLGSELIGNYVRSLGVIFGRELVNTVTWGNKCTCLEKKCDHSRAAVQMGVEYIRFAKDGLTSTDQGNFLRPLYQETS
jgi:hypothetical protein